MSEVEAVADEGGPEVQLHPEGPHPQQEEMPFAFVQGMAITELPRDLYIPPDALEVFLEAFAGPLDLLLYLIRRQNLDVLDIPIAEVTRQYMQYIDLMQELRLELAAEYLVMAAMLAEIKSRMLLPRREEPGEEEADPRADLVRRLQEYERYKQAAAALDDLPRFGRDFFDVGLDTSGVAPVTVQPAVSMADLLHALNDVITRAEMYSHHHIQLEPLSVRERMAAILDAVRSDRHVEFASLFTLEEGRRGVVVTFIALLELAKDRLIELVQPQLFGPIHVRAASP